MAKAQCSAFDLQIYKSPFEYPRDAAHHTLLTIVTNSPSPDNEADTRNTSGTHLQLMRDKRHSSPVVFRGVSCHKFAVICR